MRSANPKDVYKKETQNFIGARPRGQEKKCISLQTNINPVYQTDYINQNK